MQYSFVVNQYENCLGLSIVIELDGLKGTIAASPSARRVRIKAPEARLGGLPRYLLYVHFEICCMISFRIRHKPILT